MKGHPVGDYSLKFCSLWLIVNEAEVNFPSCTTFPVLLHPYSKLSWLYLHNKTSIIHFQTLL